MAKLVIGTNKQVVVPAIVKEVEVTSPLVISYTKTPQGVIQKTGLIDLDGATSVEAYGLYSAYNNNTHVSGVIDMSCLTSLTENYCCTSMFWNCPNVTGVDLSGVVTISGNGACSSMFGAAALVSTADLSNLTSIGQPSIDQYNANVSNMCATMFDGAHLQSVGLGSLETIIGKQAAQNMFRNNAYLTSVDVSKLRVVYGVDCLSSMFANCYAMREITFDSLDTIGSPGYNPFYSTFNGWRDATINFPALKTTSFINNKTGLFYQMLSAASNCTVHFPSNLESLMSGWSDVTSGFGGTNTTVLFDLTATE